MSIHKYDENLRRKDKRVLYDHTHFITLDAIRKTPQVQKDLWNDQDAQSAPSRVENLIRNVLSVKKGTFEESPLFGFDANDILFDQLDWASLEFLKVYIQNAIDINLPINVTEISLDIDPKNANCLNISLAYTSNDSKYLESGPQTIGDRIANITLSYKGFKGAN